MQQTKLVHIFFNGAVVVTKHIQIPPPAALLTQTKDVCLGVGRNYFSWAYSMLESGSGNCDKSAVGYSVA